MWDEGRGGPARTARTASHACQPRAEGGEQASHVSSDFAGSWLGRPRLVTKSSSAFTGVAELAGPVPAGLTGSGPGGDGELRLVFAGAEEFRVVEGRNQRDQRTAGLLVLFGPQGRTHTHLRPPTHQTPACMTSVRHRGGTRPASMAGR